MTRDVASNTNREADMHRERIIGGFLDDYLYPTLGEAERWSGAGTEARNEQLRGVDIRASLPAIGQDVPIDEKAQIDYINSPAPTFVLELNSYDRGDSLHRGWFFDPDYETEYYLFVWIPDCITFEIGEEDGQLMVNYNYRSEDPLVEEVRERLGGSLGEKTLPNEQQMYNLLEELTGDFPDAILTGTADTGVEYFCQEHIRRTHCLLIERARLQEFLEDEGYPESFFDRKAEEIRRSGDTGKINAESPHFDYYLTPSTRKGETPLNIVMRYGILHELGTETYDVTPDGVEQGTHLTRR